MLGILTCYVNHTQVFFAYIHQQGTKQVGKMNKINYDNIHVNIHAYNENDGYIITRKFLDASKITSNDWHCSRCSTCLKCQ